MRSLALGTKRTPANEAHIEHKGVQTFARLQHAKTMQCNSNKSLRRGFQRLGMRSAERRKANRGFAAQRWGLSRTTTPARHHGETVCAEELELIIANTCEDVGCVSIGGHSADYVGTWITRLTCAFGRGEVGEVTRSKCFERSRATKFASWENIHHLSRLSGARKRWRWLAQDSRSAVWRHVVP